MSEALNPHELLDLWFRDRELRCGVHDEEQSVRVIWELFNGIWYGTQYWYRLRGNLFILYRREGHGSLFEYRLERPDFFEQLDEVISRELGRHQK